MYGAREETADVENNKENENGEPNDGMNIEEERPVKLHEGDDTLTSSFEASSSTAHNAILFPRGVSYFCNPAPSTAERVPFLNDIMRFQFFALRRTLIRRSRTSSQTRFNLVNKGNNGTKTRSKMPTSTLSIISKRFWPRLLIFPGICNDNCPFNV
jgi:hypothetical protein